MYIDPSGYLPAGHTTSADQADNAPAGAAGALSAWSADVVCPAGK